MTLAEPTTRRWKRAEYYRLAEEGWFAGQHVQLINGEIPQMAPQGYSHAQAYLRALRVLNGIFAAEHSVRPQLPLHVPGESDPEPDIAVTEFREEQYKNHPATAIRVVEIADRSIHLERRKAGLYAAAGVADYWIVNLNSRRIEVFRQPVADPEREFGHRYAESFELSEADFVAPAARPEAKIPVKNFFQ